MPLLECVPNVSEGRRPETIRRLAAALAATPGAHLLHQTSDADHNRSVFTLAGEPEPLVAALLALYAVAKDEIDLSAHRGVHPRVGAVDVVPFVPLPGTEMSVAVAAAETLGAEVARRFDLAVYLYERAARRPERRALPDIRRGGFERFAEKIRQPAWSEPDFGPARVHPTAGVSVIGARPILVAWNILLDTDDLFVARRIARAVRARTPGGLPAVRAIGVPLARLGAAQVSLNLLDVEMTSMAVAFDRVSAEASAFGSRPIASELIGLVPEAALPVDPLSRLLLPDPTEQILERRLALAGLCGVDESEFGRDTE